jgi:hypothetical protein
MINIEGTYLVCVEYGRTHLGFGLAKGFATSGFLFNL